MEPGGEARVGPGDASAIDAWLARRAGEGDVPADAKRLEALERILGLLESQPADLSVSDPALVDAAMLRISRVAESMAAPRLDTRSADALDAWAMAGYRSERVPAGLRAHAAMHERLASAVRDSAAPASSADLLDKTLERIGSADRSEAFSFEAARSRWSWRDAVSVAAVVLIGVSILWPIMAQARAESRQVICAANLGSTGRAFSAYSTSNAGTLPMATAGFRRGLGWKSPDPSGTLAAGGEAPGPVWWRVGDREVPANSANLFVLVRTQFADLEDLACPGNARAPRTLLNPEAVDWSSLEEVSYSYQLSADRPAPMWARPGWGVLLADRSAVVERAVRGERADPFENSSNHRRRGQHVLRVDGSVHWLTSPQMASGDNLWLPRVLEEQLEAAARAQGLRLRGWERPADAEDAFVGP